VCKNKPKIPSTISTTCLSFPVKHDDAVYEVSTAAITALSAKTLVLFSIFKFKNHSSCPPLGLI
jgi:hypothetical protein